MDVWVLTIVTHFLFMGFIPAQQVYHHPVEYASLQQCLAAGATATQETGPAYGGVSWMPVTTRAVICEKEASV